MTNKENYLIQNNESLKNEIRKEFALKYEKKINELINEAETLNNIVAQKSQENEELLKRINENKETLGDISNRVDRKENNKKSYKQKYDTAINENEELKKKIDDLEAKIQNLQINNFSNRKPAGSEDLHLVINEKNQEIARLQNELAKPKILPKTSPQRKVFLNPTPQMFYPTTPKNNF